MKTIATLMCFLLASFILSGCNGIPPTEPEVTWATHPVPGWRCFHNEEGDAACNVKNDDPFGIEVVCNRFANFDYFIWEKTGNICIKPNSSK